MKRISSNAWTDFASAVTGHLAVFLSIAAVVVNRTFLPASPLGTIFSLPRDASALSFYIGTFLLLIIGPVALAAGLLQLRRCFKQPSRGSLMANSILYFAAAILSLIAAMRLSAGLFLATFAACAAAGAVQLTRYFRKRDEADA